MDSVRSIESPGIVLTDEGDFFSPSQQLGDVYLREIHFQDFTTYYNGINP